MAGLFKYLIAVIAGLLCYNEFVLMHRTSAFNDVEYHMDKSVVPTKIGDAKYTHICGTQDNTPAFLEYIDSFCKDKVVEVDAHPLCYISMRCRGWNYVAYDKDNRMLVKYHLGN